MPFQPTPQPCWLILIEGDWVGCGADYSQAVRLARRIAAEEAAHGAQAVDLPMIRPADGYCVLVSCSGCERWWTSEDGMAVHSAGMVEALKEAAGDGWAGDVCPACRLTELLS